MTRWTNVVQRVYFFIDAILLVMPEIFYPSKRDWLFVIAASAMFVAVSAWLSAAGESGLMRCVGGMVVIGSLIVFVFALFHLIPNSSFLEIAENGIAVRSFWRTTQYRWVDISEFGVAEFQTEHGGIRQTHQRVGFNFSRYAPQLKRATSPDRLAARIGGYEAALPDTYGQNCAELAAHLNQQRNRFLRQGSAQNKTAHETNA